jgi:WD40 repeat protein
MLRLYETLVNGNELAGLRPESSHRPAAPRKHARTRAVAPPGWRRFLLLVPLLLMGFYLVEANRSGDLGALSSQVPTAAVVAQFPLLTETQFSFTTPLRVQATSDGRLALVNEDTGEYRMLKVESLVILEAAFAGRPDRFVVLAHQSADSFRGDFFLVDFGKGSIQQLTDSSDTVPKGPPSFSPKGDELLFPDGGAVRILDLASGNIATVVPPDNNLSWIVSANWSPDGEWIVYLRVSPACEACTQTVLVSVIRPDGTDERLLYSTQRPDLIVGSIGFSPDGEHVGFVEDGKNYVVAVDGSSSAVEVDENTWAWLPSYFPQWP